MTAPRAVAVVTGSELVRGERGDLNGPFYMREALRLGLEPARIHIVGDDPVELEAALREAASEADVCLVSGGLGPTHDDRTVELVARVVGAPLAVDEALEEQIGGISRRFAERQGRPYADFAPGVRKQATVPAGATVLGIAGTAPGLVVPGETCVFVVLPGPPGELQKLWPRALEASPLHAVLERATPPVRHVQRFYGASESLVAKAFTELGGDGDGVEVTICAREFEIHVDTLARPGAEARAETLAGGLAEKLSPYLFSTEERTIQELVLEECRARGLTLATAESCTGGMVASRLTDVAGSSDVFVGGVVAYSNDVKQADLGVPVALLEEHGAVSAEVAKAMADGARTHFSADLAVSVTGIAGPGGGSAEKPVGLVFLHASGPMGERAQRIELPGERSWIRARATVAALHLVRKLVTES
ncbi:MAG: CinA family nicotinamide mononucleotide deamidase-related protein [Gaiellales bacterium]